MGHANVKFVRDGVADLDLRDARLGLAVVRNERAAFLEDTSGGITGDGTVILEGDGAAVRQVPNPFGIHGGGERRVRQGRDKNADQDLAGAAVREALRFLRRLSERERIWQDQKSREQKKRDAFHQAASPVQGDYAKFFGPAATC